MSRPHVATPAELSALRDLELATRATVEGLRHGLHRSPLHGYSEEFSQYRRYGPGDDLRHVDWKAFGRTDRFYTRQFRDTTNLQALFVVDVSRSMDFEGKLALARTVAAVLGTLVLDQGDAAGLLAVGDRVQLLPPRSGHHHLRPFLSHVSALGASGAAGVDQALARAARVLKRRGLVVALSDLYEESRALAEVRRLARMGHDVVVVHTLSKGETDLAGGGACEFVDLESGRTLLASPSAARTSYATAVAAWLTAIDRALEREGIDKLRLVAGEPIEPPLRRFLIRRRERR